MLQTFISIYIEIPNFFMEFVGEPLIIKIMSYPDMNNFLLFQVIDLGNQIDQINLEKSNCLKIIEVNLITFMLELGYFLYKSNIRKKKSIHMEKNLMKLKL